MPRKQSAAPARSCCRRDPVADPHGGVLTRCTGPCEQADQDAKGDARTGGHGEPAGEPGTAGDGQSQQRLQPPARLLVVQRADVAGGEKRETTSANSTKLSARYPCTVATSPTIRSRPDRRACSEMLSANPPMITANRPAQTTQS